MRHGEVGRRVLYGKGGRFRRVGSMTFPGGESWKACLEKREMGSGLEIGLPQNSPR